MLLPCQEKAVPLYRKSKTKINMKKVITLLAVLLVMAVTAKAQTQPINVVCDAPEIENNGTDIIFIFYSFDGGYGFRFDIFLNHCSVLPRLRQFLFLIQSIFFYKALK